MVDDPYPIPTWWCDHARVDEARIQALSEAASADPDACWLEQARRLDWDAFPTRAGDWSFARDTSVSADSPTGG